jgi:glycine/D-amino acid oxidase-like deaminating enzyme
MRTEVFWKNPNYHGFPELKKDTKCDYLIVGGGISGVSTAYFLQKFGAKNIILIEKEKIAGGATGRAAGILTPNTELDLKDVLRMYGNKHVG